MISNHDFVATAKIPLDEGWGYIWGKSGQIWTKAQQEAATREQTIKWGSRWIGKKVADCSGYVCWVAKQYGESVYHGSNTMFRKYCSAKGKLKNGYRADTGDDMPIGCLVFKYDPEQNSRYHVGIYIGGETVIEAKGTYYGVVTSTAAEWDEWGLLCCVDYDGDGTMELKKGSRGNDVCMLQELLNNLGFDCGNVDGIFGTKTENAVKAAQRANNLPADGVATQTLLDILNNVDHSSADADDGDETILHKAITELKTATGSLSRAVDLLESI